jgi:hypothetical protein
MTLPHQAVEQARRAAAQMRDNGAYADATPSRVGPPRPEMSEERLAEWAVVEPDLRHVRSTRRLGYPITLLKRGLLRLLVQYHAQMLGDQARFNLLLLGYAQVLEARIAELEARLGVDSQAERAQRDPGVNRGRRDVQAIAEDVARLLQDDPA